MRPHALHGDINVTPLVDVCLVLLIIFMVVAPILTPGVPVPLPQTRAPQRLPPAGERLEVTLLPAGEIWFGDRRVAPQELREALALAPPGETLLVRADRRLRFAEVRATLQAASEAGFRQAALETVRRVP